MNFFFYKKKQEIKQIRERFSNRYEFGFTMYIYIYSFDNIQNFI